MTEIWKDIKGYEGLYQVSNNGNVKRIRFINNKINKQQERNIIATDNGKGYKVVGLCKNGKRKNYYVHRLVAETFLDNKNSFKEINHIDSNKSNNCLNNLEWCDRRYNIKYSYDKGNHKPNKAMLGRKGREHPISKPVKQYDLKGNFIKEYESASLASKITNICYMSIKKCRCGKQKTAGGFIWVY